MIMVSFLAMMVVWLSSQNIYEVKFSHKSTHVYNLLCSSPPTMGRTSYQLPANKSSFCHSVTYKNLLYLHPVACYI